MKKRYSIGGVVVIGLGLVMWFGATYREHSSAVVQKVTPLHSQTKPHSFAECVAQGYPVQAGTPRRCQVGNIAFTDTPELSSMKIQSAPVVLKDGWGNTPVVSPAVVHGTAMGAWFFEATFPVRILDAQGSVVAEAQAHADGDWQTTDYVPFTVTLSFSPPRTETGFVEFAKDNPSGLSDLDASVRIPIRFK